MSAEIDAFLHEVGFVAAAAADPNPPKPLETHFRTVGYQALRSAISDPTVIDGYRAETASKWALYRYAPILTIALKRVFPIGL
jgi:hypothetical protein